MLLDIATPHLNKVDQSTFAALRVRQCLGHAVLCRYTLFGITAVALTPNIKVRADCCNVAWWLLYIFAWHTIVLTFSSVVTSPNCAQSLTASRASAPARQHFCIDSSNRAMAAIKAHCPLGHPGSMMLTMTLCCLTGGSSGVQQFLQVCLN